MREQYKSYSSIQLAGEDVFIAWVRHGAHAREWEEWLQQHTQAKVATEEAKRIVLDLVHLPEYVLSDEEQHGLWDNISFDISLPSPPEAKIKRGWIRWLTVAAAAVVLLIWLNTKSTPITILALAGEQKAIQLPESSHIQLNSGSRLIYDARHFDSDREVKLVGEAFFKVHPGSKFTVITPQGSVTVLGTSFNVIAWPDRFEVTCYTGKVMVENESKDRETITPGERCTTDEESRELQTNLFPLSAESPDWTRGKFVFENQPLKIVVEELERQYNIKVKLAPGLAELKYVGLFDSGDLDKALSLITWPLHLKVEKNGDTVSIVR